MARLRAYVWNKNGMLELVRYQRSLKKKVVGAEGIEEIVCEANLDELNAHLQSVHNIKYGEEADKR